MKDPTQDDTLEAWRQRIGKLDPRQITAWRAMTPAQRLDLACQAIWLICLPPRERPFRTGDAGGGIRCGA